MKEKETKLILKKTTNVVFSHQHHIRIKKTQSLNKYTIARIKVNRIGRKKNETVCLKRSSTRVS